jgi:hypothetical protein
MPPFFTELIAQCNAVAEPPCISILRPSRVCIAFPAASAPTASMQTSAPSQSVVCLQNSTTSSISSKL